MSVVNGGHDNLHSMRFAHNYNAIIVKGILKELNDGKIMDFGAGDGYFAEKIGKSSSSTPICVEPDGIYLDMLEEKGLKAYKSLDDVVEEEFDFIYTLNVLEHIPDDKAALFNMRKKLHVGGKIYIFVPAFQVLYGNMDRMLNHVRRYSRKEALAKVIEAGFKIEKVSYFDSLGFLVAVIHKLLKGSGKLSIKSIRFYDSCIFPVSCALDLLFSGVFGKNLVIVARAL